MMSGKGKPTPKKGVSKVKEEGKSTSKLKIVEVPEMTPKDNVLTYPFIKTCENDRLLPRYSAVLHRTEDEGVGMDDLDALQLELESLLSAVAVRCRVLQDEIQALNNAEDRQDKRGKLSPLVPAKRIKTQERFMKKVKETPKIVGESYQASVSNKFMKTKGLSTITTSAYMTDELADSSKSEIPKALPLKNDTPNKFWAFVDPYCADITQDDIKLIEALIEENNDNEYYQVPSLGHHYSLCWGSEDGVDGGVKSDMSGIATRKLEKSGEDVTTGPLTQRLISALMEENFASVDMICKGDENRTLDLFKSFTVGHSSSLERRVRRELEEQGLFDSDVANDEENDEILQELQRCQDELKIVTEHNAKHLQRLLMQANEELVRQDLKKRLQQADNEVLGIHQKVLAARQKKKVFSKKEQELCWKALKDRDILLRHIDSLNL